MTTRVGLIGCVSEKLTASARSGDLYISDLFHGRKRYVMRSCETWLIISAKYGLLHPADVIEPYDETLKGQPAARKRAWAKRVMEQLVETFGEDLTDFEFEIHAGADYRDFGLAEGLRSLGATVINPVRGLGIGKQKAFYRAANVKEW